MMTIIQNTLKSPILHFTVLGILAYILYIGLMPVDKETIKITSQTIDALVQQEESLSQIPVTAEKRNELIENYIDEEILLREAYKRGLDKSDYRVRKRILNIMRTSLTDIIPEPTYAELSSYYEKNKDRYLLDTSKSFQHIYFSYTNDNLPVDTLSFINFLSQISDIDGLGDYFATGNNFRKASYRQIALYFGKPFVDRVFEAPLNKWLGPLESIHGFHFLRVLQTHDPEIPSFETMESYLRTDYLIEKSRERQQEKINKISTDYIIILEEGVTGS